MSWTWSDTLELIGLGAEVYGSYQQNEAEQDYFDDLQAEQERIAAANAELSYEDAQTALKQATQIRKQAERNQGLRIHQMERMLSTQKKVFANSGVVSNTGTALDIQRKTAADMTEDMNIEYWNGRTAESRAHDLARRYITLGNNGLRDAAAQSQLIGQQAYIVQQNRLWEAGGNVLSYISEEYA